MNIKAPLVYNGNPIFCAVHENPAAEFGPIAMMLYNNLVTSEGVSPL